MSPPPRRSVKPLFSLSPVAFRDSPIAGRGVFARRRFAPGETVVAYAPKQARVRPGDPAAVAAAAAKISLLSDGEVIVPDTTVPGGWLCNHSCEPNAELYVSGGGRIQCLRPISPGDEVTIFYGWVTRGEPERDPCRCRAARCRGFVNFDLDEAEVARGGDALARRLADYEEFLRAIGQEHVMETVLGVVESMRAAARSVGPG